MHKNFHLASSMKEFEKFLNSLFLPWYAHFKDVLSMNGQLTKSSKPDKSSLYYKIKDLSLIDIEPCFISTSVPLFDSCL